MITARAPLPEITVKRTGGFAGVSDTVRLDPQGVWAVTDRAGTRTTGLLEEDQAAEIRALAADPRLAAEAGRAQGSTRCRDAFHYAVTVGTMAVGYIGCPADPDQPDACIALVERLLRFTTSAHGSVQDR